MLQRRCRSTKRTRQLHNCALSLSAPMIRLLCGVYVSPFLLHRPYRKPNFVLVLFN